MSVLSVLSVSLIIVLLLGLLPEPMSGAKERPPRRRLGKTSKGVSKSGSKKYYWKGNGSKNGMTGPEAADLMCVLFEAFNQLGRRENNDRNVPGMPWKELCDDLEGLDPLLCPNEPQQTNVCANARKPHLNPAIRKFYCGPLLSRLEATPERRESCLLNCINFVSPARGDCCGLRCDDYEP